MAADAYRLLAAEQGWKAVYAVERLARRHAPPRRCVRIGDGLLRAAEQDLAALHHDRTLDPPRVTLGGMAHLVRTEAFGEHRIHRMERDQHAEVLRSGHRRVFRVRSGGWPAGPEQDHGDVAPDPQGAGVGIRIRRGRASPSGAFAFFPVARAEQLHAGAERTVGRLRQLGRIEGGVAFFDHGVLREADEVEQTRVGQVRGHHILQRSGERFDAARVVAPQPCSMFPSACAGRFPASRTDCTG